MATRPHPIHTLQTQTANEWGFTSCQPVTSLHIKVSESINFFNDAQRMSGQHEDQAQVQLLTNMGNVCFSSNASGGSMLAKEGQETDCTRVLNGLQALSIKTPCTHSVVLAG